MRDILVATIVFGSLPFIFKRPYIGVLMWVWISVMNPHTHTWGFASTIPFAAIIAGVTLVSLVFTKDDKEFPFTPVTNVLIFFVLWMNVTSVFALEPEGTFEQWKKVMKIMLMTFVTLMLIKSKRHIQLLVLVVTVSIAFYGIKGGIFTIRGGGENRVVGPPGAFIEGNNEIALAVIMCVPLLHYFQIISSNKWVRHGLTVAIMLCAAAALGTHSRGALVAIGAMSGFLWLKSRQKVGIALLMILAAPLLLSFMPEKWSERMATITDYEEDGSVQGRFNAWWMAFNLAMDRPIVGGGFDIITQELFYIYAPHPNVHSAHSIYFQALGEHGFVGLGLYLLLGLLTWKMGNWIVRNTRQLEGYKWAHDLASMIQVSLIGFATGAAFLGLLYFDVPYYLMAAMVATRILVERELKEKKAALEFVKKEALPSAAGGLKPSQAQPVSPNSG